MTEAFAERLAAAVRSKRSPCCIGLDPRPDWLPGELRRTFGLRPTAAAVARAVEAFHARILERLAPIVPIVKPQLAFFEQLGAPGVAAYEDLVARARSLGILVLADAKRADIGPTSEAYARAFLGGATVGGADVSPPAADALTVQPYMGSDSLAPFVDACDRRGAGIFVLVKTSNPGSGEIQDLRSGDRRVCEHVAAMVARLGEGRAGPSGYSPVGAVVGATHPRDLPPLRAAMPNAVLLLPGYGAQGASADDVVGAFDARGGGALVVAARSVNFAYRRADGAEDPDWEASIERAATHMREAVVSALGRAGKSPT